VRHNRFNHVKRSPPLRFICYVTMSVQTGRKQDRARVAGGQDYEVRYEARKTGKSRAAVKKAVGKVGDSRKKRRLASG
jgi:hypothetical protein